MAFSQETNVALPWRVLNVYWIEGALYLRFSLLKDWIPGQ